MNKHLLDDAFTSLCEETKDCKKGEMAATTIINNLLSFAKW